MNKRDFLKGSAALSLAPALVPGIASVGATAAAPVAKLAAALPTPSYVYDSARRAMRFHRSDAGNREMFAYFARG